ncbi:BspA family leucine-rich repeat surface protein [Lactococcus lactis subsp. lactis]|uniref:BspA family leucine-rich repeat surface protein n=1 Tax=Lactococcus lactis TaxID=1358 RepID=UPI00223A91EB|nr:BspA family leucine-rich repeat surface protein [Lactococcus lactis]MCT0015353.1 BspA family leucine-rich repeat surface protein [Lactococcus lactis subsp. lactis]
MKNIFRKKIKFKKYSIPVIAVLAALSMVLALSSIVIPKIMAGDTVVSDLHIQAESEGNIISLHIIDENESDTKVVVPLPDSVTYKLNQTSNIGVTEDTINHQLVIDWVDGQAKDVKLQLDAQKSGVYDFVIQTVREEEPVNSQISNVQVNDLETKEENDITTGTCGTAPWKIDSEGVLHIEAGTFTYTGPTSGSPWKNWANNINKIIFEGRVLTNIGASSLFMGLSKVVTIENIANLDTSNATNMSWMFQGMTSLTDLDLSSFDTSQVKDMRAMFYENSSLTDLDLSNFDTSQVKDMGVMFSDMRSLTDLDLSSFDTSQVKDMDAMFQDMRSLTDLDVSSFDTSQVKKMGFMFSSMSSLTDLDVSSFDTSQVKDMNAMFYNMRSLTDLDLSSFDTSQVTNMSAMFSNMSSLTDLDLSSFDTSQVTNMSAMFNNVSSLSALTLGSKFKFLMDAGLGNPVSLVPGLETTGKWIKEKRESNAYTPTEFMQNYGSSALTPGTYVADIINPGEITAETKIDNLTHSNNSDEYYVNDEVRIDNTIHHKGEIWNFLYKTVIPKEITLDEESIKGYAVTEEGNKIDIPSESFKFDESSRVLEVNLKNIAEPSKEGNYYTAVDTDFHYELTAKINKDSLGKNLEVQTTISYFDSALRPKPDVNIKTENKKIFGLEPRWNLEEKVKNLSRTTNYAVGDEIEITIIAQNDNEFGAMNSFDLTEKTFSKDLDFVIGSAELILPNGDIEKLPDSVYQEDKRIITTNVFSENNYVGLKPYQLRFKAKVRKSAYQKDIEFNSTLSGKNNLNKDIALNGETQTININFSGELRFENVPDIMSFEDSKISNRTVESSRRDKDWKITVEDTRLEKKPWRVATKLLTPFKDTTGAELQSDILLFRKAGQEDQWINNTSETDVYDGTSTKEDYYDVSWSSNEGPLIQVAPGTVKVGQYKGVMQWSLIDAPA